MEQTCKECSHSEFTRKNEYGEIVTLIKGKCRRFPPQYNYHGTSWGDYSFPEVRFDDWCGEWKGKEA